MLFASSVRPSFDEFLLKPECLPTLFIYNMSFSL